jgi:oligopeptide transport system substrate-binding protein
MDPGPEARRIATACAAIAAIAVVLSGCGTRAPEGPRPGGTLRLALRDSFSTLDPALAWDPALTPYLRLLYEGLVAFDDSGAVRPAAAAHWSTSADGLTWRFELRSGLRYASGEPITSADFARAIERLFRPGVARSPGAPQFAAIEGALRAGARNAPPLGVDASDPSVLVLRLAWRDPFLLEKLAQPRYVVPVPERAATARAAAGRGAGAGGAAADYGAAPETNGPYALQSGGRNVVHFVRNRRYVPAPRAADTPADRLARTREAGFPDTIVVLTGVSARRALLGIESGRIDALSPLPIEYRERLLRDRRLAHVKGELSPPLLWYLALNAELAPLARRDARRAMARAVNRLRLSETLGAGFDPWREFTGETGVPNAAPGYDPNEARYSLEAARYFAGIRVPVTVPRGTAEAAACEALAPAAARGSIQFEPQPVSRPAWVKAAAGRRGAQAVMLPWVAPANDDVDALAALLLNRGLGASWGGNWAWYHPSAAFDSLLVRGLREADPVARSSIRDQIGQILESDLPLVPVARVRLEAVVRPEWGGARVHPRTGFDPAALWRRDDAKNLTTNR